MYVQWLASIVHGVERAACCSFRFFQSTGKVIFHHGNSFSSVAFVPSKLVLLCISFVKMSSTTNSCSCFRAGAIVFLKALQVLSAGNLGQLYGSRASKMHLPGLDTSCKIRKSFSGRHLRYLTCQFFFVEYRKKLNRLESSLPKFDLLIAVSTWNTF